MAVSISRRILSAVNRAQLPRCRDSSVWAQLIDFSPFTQPFSTCFAVHRRLTSAKTNCVLRATVINLRPQAVGEA
jgi:hypothetical protein